MVQDLVIHAHNTRYHLERRVTPEGEVLTGELPPALRSTAIKRGRTTATY